MEPSYCAPEWPQKVEAMPNANEEGRREERRERERADERRSSNLFLSIQNEEEEEGRKGHYLRGGDGCLESGVGEHLRPPPG